MHSLDRAEYEEGHGPSECLTQWELQAATIGGVDRVIKRAIAREVFKSLAHGLAAPDLSDLRPTRQAKNITLRTAADALGTYPAKLARTELGTFPDYDLAQRYRARLAAA